MCLLCKYTMPRAASRIMAMRRVQGKAAGSPRQLFITCAPHPSASQPPVSRRQPASQPPVRIQTAASGRRPAGRRAGGVPPSPSPPFCARGRAGGRAGGARRLERALVAELGDDGQVRRAGAHAQEQQHVGVAQVHHQRRLPLHQRRHVLPERAAPSAQPSARPSARQRTVRTAASAAVSALSTGGRVLSDGSWPLTSSTLILNPKPQTKAPKP